MNNPKFLEIVFPAAIAPGDLDIIQPATSAGPGEAALAAARIEQGCRVMSANGGGLIGVISEAKFMLPPYDTAYWLAPTEEKVSEVA